MSNRPTSLTHQDRRGNSDLCHAPNSECYRLTLMTSVVTGAQLCAVLLHNYSYEMTKCVTHLPCSPMCTDFYILRGMV